MSAHGKSFEQKIEEAIEAVPNRQFSGTASIFAIGCIGWGAAAFGLGLVGSNPGWTWGAFLVAIVWHIGIAQGGVAFAAILAGTQARWGRPLKRIGEAFGFYLPVLWILLAVFLVGGITIYEWHPHTITRDMPVALAPHMQGAANSKEFWLQPGFFAARQLGVLGILILLDWIFIRASLRPDLILAKQKLGSSAPAWWSRITGGSNDVEAAVESGLATQYTMVPILGFAYSAGMSLLMFDLLMSLDAWWFSNMFGGWLFMSSLWLALAGIAAFTMAARDWLGMGDWLKSNVTHDLGKLMLAGCMFWAYTLFAQILPIWYTNVPEETNFLLVRMMLPQWSWLAQLVAVMCFLAPFTILLSRGVKKMRWPFFAVSVLIMTGLFFERTLLVMPSVHLGPDFPYSDFLFQSVGIFAGVFGGFVLTVSRVLAAVPVVPIADPMLDEHPWDVHVHPAETHAL